MTAIRVVGDFGPIYRLAPVPSGNGQSMTKIMIDEGYRPSDDEPFMNDRQREYFRRKLIRWKGEILREAQETLATLQSENENHPDLADRASSETDRPAELRPRAGARAGRPGRRAARPRPPAEAHRQDRLRVVADRGRVLRLLRGGRRADRL